MKPERDQRAVVERVAVRCLKNELKLAVQLLKLFKRSRIPITMEDEVVIEARAAFRHATDALERLPQLPPKDLSAILQLMDDFRASIAEIVL